MTPTENNPENEEDYPLDHLYEENVEDERRLSDFVTNVCFALIAASWAIYDKNSSNIGHLKRAFVITVTASILVLFLKLFRSWLIVKHNRKILDTEAMESPPFRYSDASPEQTCFGKWNQYLLYPEYFILIVAFVAFAIGSVKAFF